MITRGYFVYGTSKNGRYRYAFGFNFTSWFAKSATDIIDRARAGLEQEAKDEQAFVQTITRIR